MFETSTHRGCIYIEQQSYELIDVKEHRMITTVVTVTSTFLAGSFGAAAVAALILFLIMRELTSAHAEESGSMRSKVLSHTLLVPISPLLVVFAFIVAVKVLEVL